MGQLADGFGLIASGLVIDAQLEWHEFSIRRRRHARAMFWSACFAFSWSEDEPRVSFSAFCGNTKVESQLTAEQAFDAYHKAVYRFAYRLLGRADLAEDITQDCFLSILRYPERWNPARGDMRTYLFSIARNLARKQYRDEHADSRVDEDWAMSVVDQRPVQEISAAVAQAVARLPDLQREVLILFEYEGFQLTEIAQIVEADIGVVKSRLHRARQRLKRSLAPCRSERRYANVCE